MEANKIAYDAKSVILDNGVELTFCELGEQNEEVLVTGAFYFHTLMPVVELLAERYHVYGVVMRFDGETDERNPDGSTNWTRQWGADIYRFAKALRLEKFRYFGKCHGTIPGWYLVKEHPEMLEAFASFYLAPHVLGQNSNNWFEMADSGDVSAMMASALRKPKSGLKKKMAELAALGDLSDVSKFEQYAACPEKIWDSIDDAREALLSVGVPVGYLFANDDPVFRDYYDSNIWAIMNTRRARTVILNGEKHLMELDSPERVANEVFKFFEEARPDYYDEDEETPEIADAASSDAPDEGFAGNWVISFKGPMGEQKMPLDVTMSGVNVQGSLVLMGKKQTITSGIATKAGFDFEVSVKIAFKKGTARIRGTRNGDSISGWIMLPVGDVDFAGTRG